MITLVAQIWLAGIQAAQQGDLEARDFFNGTFGPCVGASEAAAQLAASQGHLSTVQVPDRPGRRTCAQHWHRQLSKTLQLSNRMEQ